MAKTFWFKAKDWSGQVHTGSILADGETAVARYCREKGYFVLQIREQSRQGGILDTITNSLQPVNTKDLAILCRQCATMTAAGVALISCLSVLIDQTANRRIKAALQSVYNKVKAGEGFSQALADHPQVFPAIMVNMVEAGEVGGMLDDVLNRLAIQLEKEYKLNEKVKSAMTYPAVVIAMAVVCVVFILTFVMPTFLTLFSGIELPWPTRMLLALSDCMQTYWWLILSALGCLLLVVKHTCNRKQIRKKL
ncbi:MAG: type II secretion system F family protein, partial [Sporomusa sp.]